MKFSAQACGLLHEAGDNDADRGQPADFPEMPARMAHQIGE
ncbi:MAG TPA: hypothetical protein VGL08_19635 [Paraburkholderia sp.]|jgi:hypothetical protein